MSNDVPIVKVTYRGENQDNWTGILGDGRVLQCDNVPIYDFEVVEGSPVLCPPIVSRLTSVSNRVLGFLTHTQCVWLQKRGVIIEGLLDLEKEGIEIIPSVLD